MQSGLCDSLLCFTLGAERIDLTGTLLIDKSEKMTHFRSTLYKLLLVI
ncbi:hypothetical protein NTGM5_290014 [Candidatus Nitrotoga sp. M5]|nr:hypothetical protein NTGM5_290014 [Candidatus Nitrotoga sp. M5]